MTFREDGYAAVDWASRYLERVDELPVLAQVKPGELSAKLPLSPPEHGEPFTNVLSDLDDLIRQDDELYDFKGHRAEAFPPPVAKVTSESPLWDWATVARWMFEHRRI